MVEQAPRLLVSMDGLEHGPDQLPRRPDGLVSWWQRESDFLAGTCTSYEAIAARVAELLPTVRPEQLEHFERIGPRRKPYTIDPLGNWHELTELGALVLEAAAAERGPAPKFTGVDWFAKSGDDIFSRADPSDDEDECTWGVFKP